MILLVLGMTIFIVILVYLVNTWEVQINEDNEYYMQKQNKDVEKSIGKEKKHVQ